MCFGVLTSPSSQVTLTGGVNIDGDIFRDNFQLKYLTYSGDPVQGVVSSLK